MACSNIFTQFHSSSPIYLEAVHLWFEKTKKKLWLPCCLQPTEPETAVNDYLWTFHHKGGGDTDLDILYAKIVLASQDIMYL